MARDKAKCEQARREKLQNGLRVKAEAQAFKEQAHGDRAEWVAKGRELALRDRQQKARVREVLGLKSQRVAELTAVAKQEELDYERNLRYVRDRLHAAKCAGAGAVRAATADEVIDGAKRFAFEQRKQAATSTRTAQQTWREERRAEERNHLAKARANKAAAEASRKRAKELRERLEISRRAEATTAREKQRRDKMEKERAIVYAAGGIRDTHDALYRERYVSEDEATAMTTSLYGRSTAS